MKKKNKFIEIVDEFGDKQKLCFYLSNYQSNGNMAIELVDDEDDTYCGVTVNLDMLMPGYGFIDTNNSKWLEKFLKKNKFAKPTGTVQSSGYCVYPLYKFNLKNIKEYLHRESDYEFMEIVNE